MTDFQSDLTMRLNALVRGMTGLRHDGRFHEPNLDGSAGDYISFDSWEWPQGVGLYGLTRLWLLTGRADLRNLVEAWYEKQIAAGLPALNVNTTAPMLGLALLWGETRDARWQPVLDAWAGRVMRDLPRTLEGGFEHIVSDKENPGELWDDTLFMVALFLGAYGHRAGKAELVAEAERQFLVHARYLVDPKTGLWFHGWSFDGRHNFARARWARGNAWIVAGIIDFIEMAGIGGGIRAYLLGILTTQVETLIELQAKSGAWHTLLDDPDSYEEISATAGIGYGLLKAARLGVVPPAEAARWQRSGKAALDAVLRNIDADGTVQNVSYGTRMGHDLQFYRDIPIQPTGYGQALAILCLTEGLLSLEASERAA